MAQKREFDLPEHVRTMGKKVFYLPGSIRYQPKGLVPVFGYDHLYQGLAMVELANLDTLVEIGVIPQNEAELFGKEIRHRLLNIPTSAVDKLERAVTKHDVRAWVQIAQESIRQYLQELLDRHEAELPPDVRLLLIQLMHAILTSWDALGTGYILLFLRGYFEALKPAIKEDVQLLIELVRKFADLLQVGRTHGQHALPITAGFWLATILDRILYNWDMMEFFARGLVGGISGAVGAYNAQVGLGFNKLCGEKTYEQRVLEKLGLRPARISTQVLPPEPLAYFLYSCAMMSAALGQFGRDFRQLMRTEIGEVLEEYEEGQVGSSTMAQKRNPISAENTEGMWIRTKNEFGKVMDTAISEHQRDLVGSCVARDFPLIMVNLMTQLDTLRRKNDDGIPFLRRIAISEEACRRNFEMSRHVILAEPLYISLLLAGYPYDAHELVNHTLVPLATSKRILLVEALEMVAERDYDLAAVIKNIPEEVWILLHQPEQYTGKAKEKALEVADAAEKMMALIDTDEASPYESALRKLRLAG